MRVERAARCIRLSIHRRYGRQQATSYHNEPKKETKKAEIGSKPRHTSPDELCLFSVSDAGRGDGKTENFVGPTPTGSLRRRQ